MDHDYKKFNENNKKFVDDDHAEVLSNQFIITEYLNEELTKLEKNTFTTEQVLGMMNQEKYAKYLMD